MSPTLLSHVHPLLNHPKHSSDMNLILFLSITWICAFYFINDAVTVINIAMLSSYFPCCLNHWKENRISSQKKVIFYLFFKITSSILKQGIFLLNVAILVRFVEKKIKLWENRIKKKRAMRICWIYIVRVNSLEPIYTRFT